jgi:hypothetical protein
MTWKERLCSNLLLRNLASDVIGYPVSAEQKTFIPYFQYKTGVYQRDYYLYFTAQPNSVQYTNNIFNKLYEYNGYDIIQYVEFHYNASDNKADFLRFLRCETESRLKLKLGKSFTTKLETLSDWLLEKQHQQQTVRQQELKIYLDQKVYNIIEKEVNKDNSLQQTDKEGIAKEIANTLAPYLDTLVAASEEKMEAIAAGYIMGNIQLNNHNHLEKLMQLFNIIRTIIAPKEIAKGEQLFKQFTVLDLAHVLHLHFEAFKDKKVNTIQGNIKEAADRYRNDNPKVQKLNKAFEEFFYS